MEIFSTAITSHFKEKDAELTLRSRSNMVEWDLGILVGRCAVIPFVVLRQGCVFQTFYDGISAANTECNVVDLLAGHFRNQIAEFDVRMTVPQNFWVRLFWCCETCIAHSPLCVSASTVLSLAAKELAVWAACFWWSNSAQ
jgi:hypothetical protein